MLYLEKEIKNMKRVINTEFAPKAIGPYSQAILSGNTLYCSGQIAIEPKSGKLITETIHKETEQIMHNIGAVLSAANMHYDNIVKCSIFMKNMNDYQKINKIYSNFFNNLPPAREALQVSKLPKNANIEISIIAVK